MDHDADDPQEYIVRCSTKTTMLVFLASSLAVALGVFLEYQIASESSPPSGQFRLNWAWMFLAAICMLISGYVLLRRPILLRLDAGGVSSTLHTIVIPWDQIISARLAESGVARFVVMQVHDPDQITGSTRQRKRFENMVDLAEDEIPISLITSEVAPELILQKVQSEIEKRAS